MFEFDIIMKSLMLGIIAAYILHTKGLRQLGWSIMMVGALTNYIVILANHGTRRYLRRNMGFVLHRGCADRN